MPTLTSNYSFNKPLVNNQVDADLWGGQLNTNWDSIDGLLYTATNTDITSISSVTTLTASHRNHLVLCDASSAGFDVDLTAASTIGTDFTVTIKKTDATANVVTIDPNSSETIDGSASYLLRSQNDAVTLVCDGTNWRVKAAFVGGKFIRAVTSTSDTLLFSDNKNVVTYDNSSSIAVTLPQAGTAGFGAGWFVEIKNKDSGVVTITPTTSTIDGNATLVLNEGESAKIFSDGSNYISSIGAVPIFSKSFESTQQTITTGGSLTLAHGLGETPRLITCAIKNVSGGTIDGVPNNAEVPVANTANVLSINTEASNQTVRADSTNVYVQYPNLTNIYVIHNTSGNPSFQNNSNWRLIVRAYA